jgi:hypothetical protein
MNSLKVRVIRLPLKLIEESLGVALTRAGGRESLGPPEGGIILAQPGAQMILMMRTNRNKTVKRNFLFMYWRKHKPKTADLTTDLQDWDGLLGFL